MYTVVTSCLWSDATALLLSYFACVSLCYVYSVNLSSKITTHQNSQWNKRQKYAVCIRGKPAFRFNTGLHLSSNDRNVDLTWNHGTVDNINTSIRRNYDKQLARILAEKTRRFARKCRGNFSYKCFIICPVVTVHLFRSRRRIRFSQIPERKI